MTVIEIARQAGVSIGTVDRVLHNRGRVSKETKEKIQKIIDSEGYQPNPLARHLKRNKSYKIGVLIPEVSKESGYWKLVYDSIQKSANEYAAFSFTVELFEFVRPDRKSLSNAFENMVCSDCSAYIIAPVMQEETLLLLLSHNVTVPYCFIDSPLPGSSPLSTVSQDPYRAGYLAGKLMQLCVPSGGNFVVLRPFSEAFNLNERVRGFTDWFVKKQNFNVRIVSGFDSSSESMEQVIKENIQLDKLDGICVVNSATNKIAKIIYEKVPERKISIIGFDLVEMNRKYLEEGKIECIISQNPEEQGRQVFQQLFHHLVLEEKPQTEIAMPFDIYFKENLI